MSRLPRLVGSATGLALVATLLLLVPTAGAVAPPFVAMAPYGPYGSLHETGKLVTKAAGTGANTVLLAPQFLVKTGDDHQAQQSWSSGASTYAFQVWSGIKNLTFDCPSSCASGAHSVRVVWNLSWTSRLNTSCGAAAPLSADLASTNISILAWVDDPATFTVVGQKVLVVYLKHLHTASVVTAGKVAQLYSLGFSATLATGGHYEVRSLILVQTHAHSVQGCASGAKATIGNFVGAAATPTTLMRVAVA